MWCWCGQGKRCGYASEPIAAWRDVVLVRAGETVRVRIRFDDFPGRTVYHCHILDHEEMGMMGTLLIEA